MQIVHNISLSGYKATFDGCFGRLPLGTAGSYGNEFLQFDAGTDWDGLVITANFVHANGEVTAVVYTPGELLPVPPEATKYSGAGDIVIEGTADGKRIYTMDIPTQITAHADLSSEAPAPTPDKWGQYIAQVQSIVDKAVPPDGTVGYVLTKGVDGNAWAPQTGGGGGGGGSSYIIGAGLKYDRDSNTLSVDTTDVPEQDNTKPITSAGVYTKLGNIDVLLGTI